MFKFNTINNPLYDCEKNTIGCLVDKQKPLSIMDYFKIYGMQILDQGDDYEDSDLEDFDSEIEIEDTTDYYINNNSQYKEDLYSFEKKGKQLKETDTSSANTPAVEKTAESAEVK